MLLTFLLALPAAAHDMWIVPASFTPAAGELVAVSLRVGHAGAAEPVKRNGRRITRFEALSSTVEPATLPVAGLDGRDPAGWVRPAEPGLWTLVYESDPAYSELDGPRFAAYLEEEGLERVARIRTAAGDDDRPGRELFSRSLKSLIAVGGDRVGEPIDRDRAVGLPLELVLENGLAPATGPRSVTLRLLWQGRPLGGALVDLRPLAAAQPALSGRTGEDGRLELELEPGAWLAATVQMEAATGTERERAEWRSVFTTLTFQLGSSR